MSKIKKKTKLNTIQKKVCNIYDLRYLSIKIKIIYSVMEITSFSQHIWHKTCEILQRDISSEILA